MPAVVPLPAVLGASVDPESLGTATKSGVDMMEDGPSVALFLVLVTLASVLAVVCFPLIFRRLSLRRAVPGLALIGPILALVGGVIGTGAMTLSGRDIWYSLFVALAAAAAAIVVGLRLANPVARDLERIVATVKAVAGGDRRARTRIERQDEIGELAAAVDDLSASLARAEDQRRVADEERNAVVGALSHDLRTPLASLLVTVDALEDGIGDASAHLGAMRANVLALERLIEDLFLLARADAGSLALSWGPLAQAARLDEAVEVLAPVAQRRSISLRTDVGRAIPVLGDHTALSRVFRNLLDNAVRHSPDGGTVLVGVSFGEGAVRVAVLDQGEGFDESFAPRALDRFSQADAARSRQGAAGLGLAIADALVSAHRGRVEITPGPGGRVSVLLPTAEGRVPAPAGG